MIKEIERLIEVAKEVKSDLGNAEWGTDSDGAVMLDEIIHDHHNSLSVTIAAAEAMLKRTKIIKVPRGYSEAHIALDSLKSYAIIVIPEEENAE